MRKITSLLISLGLFLVLTIGAQAQESEELTAKVPFEFIVNGVNLPAGEYLIARALNSNPSALMIQSRDGRHAAFFMANVEGVSEPRLAFEVVDGQHYLRQIGSSLGLRTILPSRAETGSTNLRSSVPFPRQQQ